MWASIDGHRVCDQHEALGIIPGISPIPMLCKASRRSRRGPGEKRLLPNPCLIYCEAASCYLYLCALASLRFAVFALVSG